MPRVKLILSDIDGTIMPAGSGTVPAPVIDAFHAALDAGIAIGPASGRGYAQIAPFFGGDEACCATAIATNGLEVYHGGACVRRTTLPADALEATRALVAAEPDAGLVCFEGTRPLLVAGAADDLLACARSYGETCAPAESVPDFPVVKANVFVNRDAAGTERFVARLNDEIDGLDFDMPSTGFVNIMPAGWNKGSAIEFFCKHLGVALDEVVVFGDAGNDLTMFDVVPNSVAVANAMPVAAEAARWHIGSCEDMAVGDAIRALARGEWPFER